jgi:hypothetical protein
MVELPSSEFFPFVVYKSLKSVASIAGVEGKAIPVTGLGGP